MKKVNVNFELPVPALGANIYALQFFQTLIEENLTVDDINLVATFFQNLVIEHSRINILENTLDITD